jgi:hypothetical protein
MTKFRKRIMRNIHITLYLTAASGVALLGRAVSGVALLVAGRRLLGVLLALSRVALLGVAATARQRA